jgi:hypothetical protein
MERRKTKKQIIYVLAFILLFFVGDRILADFLMQMVLKSQTRFSAIFRPSQIERLLILGNSRGVNAFYSPEIQRATGLPVLNLSYNGLSMELAEALLGDYLDRHPAPRMVIIEVTNLDDGPDVIKELKLYRKQSPRLAALLEKNDRLGATAGQWFHLYNFNGELFLRSLYYLGQSDQGWINRYRISPALQESLRQSPGEELAWKPGNMKALKRMLKMARERGIQVRLLVAPYFPEYAPKIANLTSWIQEVQEQVGPGFPVWDYSRLLGDREGFADRRHLNAQGSHLLLQRFLTDRFFS